MPDEVITKLRELVATTRFRHSWALLDQEDEIHRHTGLEAIRRLVTARGCTMADLVRLMTAVPMPDRAQENAQARAASDYQRAAASSTPSAGPAPPPRPSSDAEPIRKVEPEGRQHFLEDAAQNLLRRIFIPFRGQRTYTGGEVGRSLIGIVQVLDSRQTPFGEVVGFVVRNAAGVHGPIAALDPASIERLRTAEEAEARMIVSTIPPHGNLLFPSVTRVSVALS